jgi:hypothetical protein
MPLTSLISSLHPHPSHLVPPGWVCAAPKPRQRLISTSCAQDGPWMLRHYGREPQMTWWTCACILYAFFITLCTGMYILAYVVNFHPTIKGILISMILFYLITRLYLFISITPMLSITLLRMLVWEEEARSRMVRPIHLLSDIQTLCRHLSSFGDWFTQP